MRNVKYFSFEEKKMFKEFVTNVKNPTLNDFCNLAGKMNSLFHNADPYHSGNNLQHRWRCKVSHSKHRPQIIKVNGSDVKSAMGNATKLAEEIHRNDLKQTLVALFTSITSLLEDYRDMRTEMVALRELISAVEKYSLKRER